MHKPKMFEEAMLLRLPRGTGTRLRQVATTQGQSVSEFVRQLIRRALEKVGG